MELPGLVTRMLNMHNISYVNMHLFDRKFQAAAPLCLAKVLLRI